MQIFNPWRDDELRQSLYPFLGSEPVVTSTGLAMPADALLDLTIVVPGASAEVYLREIEILGTGAMNLRFTDPQGTVVATGALAPAPEARTPLTDPAGLEVGEVRTDSDALALVRAWGLGTHVVARRILPHLVVASPLRSRRALLDPSGARMDREVCLVGGQGVWLSIDQQTGGVVVNIEGDPYHGRTRGLRFIRTINGIQRDNFEIRSSPANQNQARHRLRVDPAPHGLKLSIVG